MAKTDKLTNEQKEIVRAQNDALLRLPADLNERLKLYADARLLRARENDQIAQVKKESGLRDHEKRLVEDYRIVPQVLKIMATLAKMPATARAAACRQLIKAIDDEQFIYRDMFDEGAIGQAGTDLEGGAVFDSTSEGRRRGGATAQPRTPEQMKASNVVPLKPTEPVPLDVAEKRLEEYRAANPPRAGAKRKELKELEASVEAARAREAGADPLADKPEAKTGEVTAGLREGVAESEQHIRDAVAGGPGAPPPPPAADKPKRASRAAKAPVEQKAAPEPQEEPDAAVEDDDSVDVGDAPAPPRPDAIGSAPSSYQAG